MIENGIARFDVAKKIDQRNLIGLRVRERANDEVEIGGGEPRPDNRPDHRDFIMRDKRADGKSDILATDLHGFSRINQEPRNGASGASDIEGKAARAAASATGRRASFKSGKENRNFLQSCFRD